LAYPVLLVSKYVANVSDQSDAHSIPAKCPLFSPDFITPIRNPIRSDGTILLEGCARGAETSQSMNLRSRSLRIFGGAARGIATPVTEFAAAIC
jgi:hypothetical protein